MKKKQVYLFACIEKNIGDDLFIYIVTQRYPDVEFIISSDAKYFKQNNVKNLKYSYNLKKWLRFANISDDKLYKKIISFVFTKFYNFRLKKLDSIYIVGNAFKNIDYKGNFQISWLKKRINLSNNFYLLSTNYGPTNSDDWLVDCMEAFKPISDICFRDKFSYNLFNSMNNVRYAPDAVLTLNINNKKNQSIHDNNKNNYIIISIIDCLFSDRDVKIKECSNTYEEKIVSIINYYNNKGYNVVLLNSNSLQDSPASDRIYNNCNTQSMNTIFDYNGNLNDIFDLYSGASIVIATRLHTIILGWLFDIPVIPIIYDVKVSNILKSYKFEDFKININDISNLDTSLLDDIISNYKFKISKKFLNDANDQFYKTDIRLK